MAVVYDFTLYRLSRVLGTVSRHAEDVVQQLEDQERNLDQLEQGVQQMCHTMAGVQDELGLHRERLAQSLAYNRSCQEAAAFHSLASMIAARDRLLRQRAH